MLLIGLSLLFTFFSLRFFRGEEESLKITKGRSLTDEERKQNYKSVRNFIEKHPSLEINKKFPEYLHDIALANRYNELNRMLKSGEISESDYQIELHELSLTIPIDLG